MKSTICKKICNPTSAVILFLLLFSIVEKGRAEIISVTNEGFVYELPELVFTQDRSGETTFSCQQHRVLNDNGEKVLPAYYMNWIVGDNPVVTIKNAVYDTISLPRDYRDVSSHSNDEVEIIDTFIVRGVKAITIKINPVRVNRSGNSLITMSRCEVEVHSKNLNSIELGPTFFNLLKKSFPNHTDGIQLKSSRTKENYLILAESGFHDALSPLITHREKEYNVSIVDAALLGGNQMLIINKIKELYANPDTRPTYLLLVGGFPLLPMNNPISTSSLGTPLNDLWYGAVDGDDHYADILVGRFSLNSGENEKVANCVVKTISYEERGLSTPKRNLYIAAGGPFADHAIEPMNYVDETYFVPGGYSGTRLFESEIDDITTDMVLNEVNEGLDFLFYSGHGNWDHWKTGHVFGKDVKKMTNDAYPIVFSFACLTGDLSTVMGECFGETWLNEKGGAVAFLGASTETTWEPDDHFQRMVVDGIFDTTISTIQGAIAYGKMSLDQNFPKYGVFYSETFNLCGDPALKVAVPGLKTDLIDPKLQTGNSIVKSNITHVDGGIHIEANNSNSYVVSFYTLQGREILRSNLLKGSSLLSTKEISSGIYTMQIQGLDGIGVVSKRVMIK